MPMVSTMPAMPGKVSVAPSSDSSATIIATWTASAMLARKPRKPYATNMKATTRIEPITPATLPAWMESWPRPGPTVRSSMTVSVAGSAPARSSTARSLALCGVKLPEICPVPPRIGSRICGAEITWLSRTMANSLPTFCAVAWPNRVAPLESKRNETTGSLVCEL